MSADQIEQTAAAWLAREDNELTQTERDALDAWLAQSSRHKVAYLSLKMTWQRTERLAALKSPAPRAEAPRRGSGLRLAVFVAAALAIFFGANINLTRHQDPGQNYSAAPGRVEVFRLADGTRMDLNADTRVHAHLSNKMRVVTLESGEAYFEVVHDAKHPFIVYAGDWRLTDLGTKFSVSLDGDEIHVMVREGRVRMDPMRGQDSSRTVMVDAGHVIVANNLETLVLTKPDEDIANALSWRSGLLVFDQKPLDEVAEQFNRHNTKQLLIKGSARKIRIGGSFKADNVDAFIHLLHRGFGLSVNDQGDKVELSR
ncbi:MAG: iron dicitrate transport regulator FecR [Alphaproteobacteria bacterium]|jgi:transmembrane sensor|nr:iron dicitrate transport regulator FecR [Alphaproteobacteria bacterium]